MNCPICASAVEEIPPVADAVSINCPRCGDYSISGTVADTEIIQRTEPERLVVKLWRTPRHGPNPASVH